MPKGYEKMRDRFVSEGLTYDRAQAKAARIWNAGHPDEPVTPHKKKRRRKRHKK